MKRSEIDPAALLGAVLAAALVLMNEKGPFGWLSTIGGTILLLVIFAYDTEGSRSFFQSVAFSAVAGFCALLATGIIPEALLGGLSGHDSRVEEWMLASLWAAETILLTFLDRRKIAKRMRG